MIKSNTEQNNKTRILSISFSYALLHELIFKFGIEEKQEDIKRNQTLSRIEEILNYISDHYHEKISLNTLAEKNCFPNSRSFVTAFKDANGMLPSTYRKYKQFSERRMPKIAAIEVSNYTDFEQHNYLGRLGEYLDTQHTLLTGNSFGVKKIDIAPIILTQKGHPLKHTFKQTTSIGKAYHILFS